MYPPIYNKEDWINAEIIVLDTRYYNDAELYDEIKKLEENGYKKTGEASFIIRFEAGER